MGTLAIMRRGTTRRVVALLSALILAFAMLALDGNRNAANAQTIPVDPNPDLSATCGIDVVLLLDSSGSISGGEITQVRDAAQAFVDGLADTGSRAGVVEFSDGATTTLGTYTDISGADKATVDAAIAAYKSIPAGLTNWEAAFVNAAAFATPADLVVMITDGNPTTSTSGVDSLGDAVLAANVVKGEGSHIFVVGVTSSPNEAAIQLISGPDGGSTIDAQNVASQDYLLVQEFANLESEIALWAETLCASITIDKEGTVNLDDVTPNDRADVGDTISYTFDVTAGNTDLNTIVVSDPLSGLSAIDCGGQTTLTAGASFQCTATYTLTQADIDSGSVDNTATASGVAPLGTQVQDQDQNSETITQDPALSVAKSDASLTTDADSSGDITLGDTVTFTITATNTGNVTLSNVVVSDPSLTPNEANCASVAPTDTCQLVGTYVVTLADANAGEFDNTGTADSDDTDPVTDMVTTPVQQDPALSVAKSDASLTTDADSSGDITPGDTVTFTITATNTGNVTLSNVVVSDPSLTPNETNCASVAPTETCVLVGTYVVTVADANAGFFDNTGTADSDDTDPVTDDVRTVVQADPAIDIVKGNQGDAGNDFQVVDAGQAATWTIVVTNTGNVTLTDVVVTDALAPDCDRDSGDIAALGSMAPGDEVTYDCTLLDVQNFLDNVAEVDADFGQTLVEDSDNSPITFISATAAIGDTVWLDEDEDGIEDPGEEGVPNADVDLFQCLDPQCNTTVFVASTTTNANGIYGFFFLEVGDYLVQIDTGSVDGDLTTPGSFIVPLGSGDEFLNADFGVEEVLPVTGIDSDRIGWMGLVLLAFGGILILGAGMRRKEN